MARQAQSGLDQDNESYPQEFRQEEQGNEQQGNPFGESKLDGVYALADALVDQFVNTPARNRALKYGLRAVGEAYLAYEEKQSEKKSTNHYQHHEDGHRKKKNKR